MSATVKTRLWQTKVISQVEWPERQVPWHLFK